MKKITSTSQQDTIIMASLFIVTGILLCFFNVKILTTAFRIIGIVCALIGLYFLYYYFKRRISTSPTPFFVGIPSVVIGIFMITSPDSFIAILPMLIGILCIVNSILSMQKAFILKDAKVSSWKIVLIFDLVLLLVGVILLLKPIQALSYILKIAGGLLIVQAILLLLTDFMLHKSDKQETIIDADYTEE